MELTTLSIPLWLFVTLLYLAIVVASVVHDARENASAYIPGYGFGCFSLTISTVAYLIFWIVYQAFA